MSDINTVGGYHFTLTDEDGDFFSIDAFKGRLWVGDTGLATDNHDGSIHSADVSLHDLKMLRVWLDEAIYELTLREKCT